jgi:hypothetical protein
MVTVTIGEENGILGLVPSSLVLIDNLKKLIFKLLGPKQFYNYIIAWFKSSLLLKIQKANTQTLQLFAKLIKMLSICKSNKNSKLNGLGAETKWSNKSGGERKHF